MNFKSSKVAFILGAIVSALGFGRKGRARGGRTQSFFIPETKHATVTGWGDPHKRHSRSGKPAFTHRMAQNRWRRTKRRRQIARTSKQINRRRAA